MDQVSPQPIKQRTKSGNGAVSVPPVRSPGQNGVKDSAGEARSLQILAAMMAFLDGDFGARLPSNWSCAAGPLPG